MTDDEKKLAAALVGLGLLEPPATLVERWAARSRELRATTLSWDRRELAPGSELASWTARHGKNHFRIDGLERDARLHYFWHGLGERVLGEGTVSELVERAHGLVRRGGPFGGPPPPDGRPVLRSESESSRVYHFQSGELRIRRFQPNFFIGNFVWTDGRVACRLITKPEQTKNAGAELVNSPCMTLSISGARVPWYFVDALPWLCAIQAPPYELLLCITGREQVAIVAVAGTRIFAVHFLAPEELANFDAGRWFAAVPHGPPGPSVSRDVGRTKDSTAREETPPDDGAAAATEHAKPGAPGKKTARGKPQRQPQRPSIVLAELLHRHFAHVAARIPAGVLGAATAHGLWKAIEDAYERDLPAISGGRQEVYATLQAAGVLRELPSEHAGRAALQALADLSPIVCRVHHRRWSLLLPELRDPTSGVVRAIRKLEGVAG